MRFFKKKTEETVHADVIDNAYIDKLLTGDRKPVKPAKQPLPTKKLLLAFGSAGLVLVFALITILVAVSVGRRTDPDFGFRDLFVPTTTQQTTQKETQKATLSTPPATTPSVKPPEPTEPPLRFDEVIKGEITCLVPNKTLELSLRQYYCTSPSLPIPEDDAPAEDWLLLFYSMLTEPGSWYNRALTSHYASPDQINMDAFLRQGIAHSASPLGSYPEAQWLLEHGFDEEDQISRMPVADINSLVGVYFGTTFADHKMPQYEPYWRYNKEIGCYYFADQTVADFAVHGIVDYEWLEDGNVCVRYVSEGWGILVPIESR